MKRNFRSSVLYKRLARRRWYWTLKNSMKDLLKVAPKKRQIVDDRHELDVAEPVLISWPQDRPKPKVGLVQELMSPPYWTKYERFLRNNQFPFEYYDVHKSDWLAASAPFDVILWATEGVVEIEEHKRKTFILEKTCRKTCFPSFDTLMWNEDKIFQYDWLRFFGFPIIETFISHDYLEALQAVPHLKYPVVNKYPVGAGSLGVELIKDAKHAQAVVRQAFSQVGRTTYWPYFRQKSFVYFQEFQPNQGFDMRVIVVGKRAFGYYRYVPQGDFRASGMGLERMAEIPEDAVLLAMQLVKKLDLVVASVDMLRDPAGALHIIEMGPNTQVNGPSELRVNGVDGAYLFDETGSFHFEPCKLWLQELTLAEFFIRWLRLYPSDRSKLFAGVPASPLEKVLLNG